MKVVFFAQYMPDPCGAFFHDIALAKILQSFGHTIHFVTIRRGNAPIQGNYRGFNWTFYTNAERELNTANVWSTPHYPFLPTVRRLNGQFRKPLIINMHFGENLEYINSPVKYDWAEFIWVISKHITDHARPLILHPTFFKAFDTIRPIMLEHELKMHARDTLPPGECITMINANALKGLGLFLELAKKHPDRKFLAVRPYYNVIRVPENIPNIEWMDIQDDIRVVLAKTRILVAPSLYESWGRVAFEAMYNGIPVLYSKPMDRKNPAARASGSTEGMQEWIGESQMACDSFTLDDWSSALEKLDDPAEYARYSKQAYDTSYGLNIFQDARDMEHKMVEYAIHYAPPKEDSSSSSSSTGERQSLSKSAAPSQNLHSQMGSARQPFRGGRFVVKR
jgi:glycosyltransferase involved in cell wall biosynthesis